MDIYNFRGLAAPVSTETKFYDKVVRFKRGERNCFSKAEISALKKTAKSGYDELLSALNECVPNDKKP